MTYCTRFTFHAKVFSVLLFMGILINTGQISQTVWAKTITPQPVPAVQATEIETQVTTGAVDPEFDNNQKWISYQDSENKIILAKVDPKTGGIQAETSKVIGQAAPIPDTFNGPEFGISQQGIGVYYGGYDQNRKVQIFRFRDGQTTQITHAPDGFSGIIPSRNINAPDVCFLTGQRQAPIKVVVVCENKPNEIIQVPYDTFGDNFLRFDLERGGVLTSLKDSRGIIQIARFDLTTRKVTFLTNDEGEKVNPFMFRAPERNNALMMLAAVNKTKLGIYEFKNNVWMRVMTLDNAFPGGEMTSPEPFTLGNKTLIITAIARKKDSDTRPTNVIDTIEAAVNIGAVVYIYSLDGKPPAIISGTSPLTSRFDPEVLIVGDEAFAYYNKGDVILKTRLKLRH